MAKGWTGISPAETGRYLFACPEPNCYRHLTFKTLEEAEAEQSNHGCPNWGGPTKVSWSVTRTLVEQMWDKLDEAVIQIIEKPQAYGPVTEAEQKARARAFAECIAIFMPPFFSTADDVAREAKKRYDAKQAGEEYETPGLGARRYEAAIRNDKPRTTRQASNQPAAVVDDSMRKAIKFALESNMFTKEQLAKTYKLSVDVITSIENS